MQLGLKVISIFLFAALWLQNPAVGKISGTVRTADGTPLAGVAIYLENDTPVTKTAADGTFACKNIQNAQVLFIAHPDFRPTAKVILSTGEPLDIVLEPESASTWWVPTCSSEPISGKVIYPLSAGLRLILPKGVKVKRGPFAIDVSTQIIEFGWWRPQQLVDTMDGGPASPRPPEYLIENSREYALRYWRSRDQSVEGVDARGIDAKGRSWRHLNVEFMDLRYSQVSAEAAKFFDSLIDSMCMPPAPKAQPNTRKPLLPETLPQKDLVIIKKPSGDE